MSDGLPSARTDSLPAWPAIERLPRRWLVTGVAGFVGSHLLEALLVRDREVVGFDNLSTGSLANLEDVRRRVQPGQWQRFRLVEGDLRSRAACERVMDGVDVVSHQAALNSVPRSMMMPVEVTEVNVYGFVNLLDAAARAGVRRFVYASSSAVYGDAPPLRRETVTGCAPSPYAASKQASESFAWAYHRAYGTAMVGLRYFNVFGPRQNAQGPYATVIPRWIAALLAGQVPEVHGDPSLRRDFTHVANVVWANLLAACCPAGQVIANVGTGRGTSLRDLFDAIRREVAFINTDPKAILVIRPRLRPRRPGDAGSSIAVLHTAAARLSYRPIVDLRSGLRQTVAWFAGSISNHSSEDDSESGSCDAIEDVVVAGSGTGGG